MATLFVSDLHLEPGRASATDRFRNLLYEQRTLDALYILGDLVEYWLGDDQSPGKLQPAFDAIAGVASTTPVYFIHGNRDFLVGDVFAARYGCRLLPDPSVIDLYGTRTLLLHGDTLCTDDSDYQAFRRMVRDPHWQRDFLQKPLAEREAIAQQVRTESQAAMAAKPMAIMDVNGDAVAAAFSEHGVTRMIHGHTHRPGIHRTVLDGTPRERIVLGDWYEGISYLLVDGDDYRVHPH